MTDVATSLSEALAFHQGDWMKKALDHAHVSSKSMAEYLDVEPATVSRWLNGKRHPSKQTLRLWALRTGVPLDYLETGRIDDDTPRPDGGGGLESRLGESNSRPIHYMRQASFNQPIPLRRAA